MSRSCSTRHAVRLWIRLGPTRWPEALRTGTIMILPGGVDKRISAQAIAIQMGAIVYGRECQRR